MEGTVNKDKKQKTGLLTWAFREIDRIATDHTIHKVPHIQESDILRSSGPLGHMGVVIGAYVGKGYDCHSAFRFLEYPEYSVPVEVKKKSSGFKYQEKEVREGGAQQGRDPLCKSRPQKLKTQYRCN